MRIRWALVLVLLAGWAAAVPGNQTVAMHPDRLGLEIQVSPDTREGQSPHHFIVTAVVRELETGSVIWSPRVSTLTGVEATVKSEEDRTRYQWRAKYLVQGATANYSIEGSWDGQPVFSTSGKIQLEASGLLPAK